MKDKTAPKKINTSFRLGLEVQAKQMNMSYRILQLVEPNDDCEEHRKEQYYVFLIIKTGIELSDIKKSILCRALIIVNFRDKITEVYPEGDIAAHPFSIKLCDIPFSYQTTANGLLENEERNGSKLTSNNIKVEDELLDER